MAEGETDKRSSTEAQRDGPHRPDRHVFGQRKDSKAAVETLPSIKPFDIERKSVKVVRAAINDFTTATSDPNIKTKEVAEKSGQEVLSSIIKAKEDEPNILYDMPEVRILKRAIELNPKVRRSLEKAILIKILTATAGMTKRISVARMMAIGPIMKFAGDLGLIKETPDAFEAVLQKYIDETNIHATLDELRKPDEKDAIEEQTNRTMRLLPDLIGAQVDEAYEKARAQTQNLTREEFENALREKVYAFKKLLKLPSRIKTDSLIPFETVFTREESNISDARRKSIIAQHTTVAIVDAITQQASSNPSLLVEVDRLTNTDKGRLLDRPYNTDGGIAADEQVITTAFRIPGQEKDSKGNEIPLEDQPILVKQQHNFQNRNAVYYYVTTVTNLNEYLDYVDEMHAKEQLEKEVKNPYLKALLEEATRLNPQYVESEIKIDALLHAMTTAAAVKEFGISPSELEESLRIAKQLQDTIGQTRQTIGITDNDRRKLEQYNALKAQRERENTYEPNEIFKMFDDYTEDALTPETKELLDQLQKRFLAYDAYNSASLDIPPIINNDFLRRDMHEFIRANPNINHVALFSAIQAIARPGNTRQKGSDILSFLEENVDNANARLDNSLINLLRIQVAKKRGLSETDVTKANQLEDAILNHIRTRLTVETPEGLRKVVTPETEITRPKYEFELRKGHFTEVKEFVGGAFGEVVLARNDQGEELIIKVQNKYISDEKRRDFDSEPLRLMQLSNYQKDHGMLVDGEPLTPSYYEEGKLPDGRHYFVMSFAKGISIDEIRSGVNLNIDIPRFGKQLCDVFESLHNGLGRGYHDFQAKNVFWDSQKGKVTVIDWNLLSPDFQSLDADQVAKLKAKDITAIGSLLLQANESTQAKRDSFYDTPIERLRRLSDSDPLKRILAKAIGVNPQDTYSSVEEMRADFEKIGGTGEYFVNPQLRKAAALLGPGVTRQQYDEAVRLFSSVSSDNTVDAAELHKLVQRIRQANESLTAT